MYSKLCEEQNSRKVAELLYIFLTPPNDLKNEMMQSNSSDNCVHYYNIANLNLFDT